MKNEKTWSTLTEVKYINILKLQLTAESTAISYYSLKKIFFVTNNTQKDFCFVFGAED
jgi:hypothetical protein